MIDIYSRQEMANIWTLESKFNYYLQVELAVCDAYAQVGEFSKDISVDKWVSKADDNLYTGKKTGKNKVVY